MRRNPKIRQYSVLEYILLALVPYSKPNLELAFKPNRFFRELEKISQANRNTLQSTLARAERQGYVKRSSGVPVLTQKGDIRIQPLTAKTLKKDVFLMVIFDIPEELASIRRQFRDTLRHLKFIQTQKSVWTSPLDYREEIQRVVSELKLQEFVQIFECAKL